ncbi:MAG TPA: hypothetical protein VER79_10285 [Candidatus Limnocylindrales bacterium]|nr:hypothetical protein [Candidatus Limnocylindrales bacterium]
MTRLALVAGGNRGIGVAIARGLAGQAKVPWLAEFVREPGFRSHYDATMAVGIIRVQDILYFVILMVISLFATTLILESRRWRS